MTYLLLKGDANDIRIRDVCQQTSPQAVKDSTYLQSWVQALQNDTNEIYRAAAEADKAAEYIKEKMIYKQLEAVEQVTPVMADSFTDVEAAEPAKEPKKSKVDFSKLPPIPLCSPHSLHAHAIVSTPLGESMLLQRKRLQEQNRSKCIKR